MSDPQIPVVAGPEGGAQLQTVLDVDASKIPPKAIEPVKTLHVFKSTMAHVNVGLANGEMLSFTQGKYVTDKEHHIAALNDAIRQGHPHIFVTPGEETVRSDMVTPYQQMRAKIIAEYEAEQAARNGRDMGTTDQSMKLNVSGTNQVVADHTTPTAGAAQLMQLQPNQLAPAGAAKLLTLPK